MLHGAKLLKHKILIGLHYGYGLRCMEARSVRLQDLDFDRKQFKVVQGKEGGALKKCPVDILSERASRRGSRRYVPLSQHLIRGLKKYIRVEKPQDYFFNGQLEKTVKLTIPFQCKVTIRFGAS